MKEQNIEKKLVKMKRGFFSKFEGLCLDWRKDATFTLLTGHNGKQYQGCIIEEHYLVVGEPGVFY